MLKAKVGDVVKVHYTGKLRDGTVFDSSLGGEPLEFTLGFNQLLPAFEEAIIGMSPGESKIFEIPAEEAFGPYRDELVIEIERTRLPQNMELEIGQQLLLRDPNGQAFRVTVIDISDDTVTLDANHPLAGEDLIFEVQLLEIGSNLLEEDNA
jgi:FKBP-type peptidyl-prolyl cis-trans isomerase 2